MVFLLQVFVLTNLQHLSRWLRKLSEGQEKQNVKAAGDQSTTGQRTANAQAQAAPGLEVGGLGGGVAHIPRELLD